MKHLLHDIRYGARILSKSPGFTFAAMFTLALGIGAITAIYSVVDAVLLKPLPYKEPGQLVRVLTEETLSGGHLLGGGEIASSRYYLEWRDQNQVFSHIAAYDRGDLTLTGAGEAEQISGGRVTADFFPLLSIQTFLGRSFTPDDDRPSSAKVVILSYGLWQRRFGGDLDIVGKTIVLNQMPYVVIGVLPASFQFPEPFEIWTPMALDEAQERYGNRIRLVSVMARLKPNIRLDQAKADLDLINERLAAQSSPPMDAPPPGMAPVAITDGTPALSQDFMQPMPFTIGEASSSLAMTEPPKDLPPPGAMKIQRALPEGMKPPAGGPATPAGAGVRMMSRMPSMSEMSEPARVKLVGLHEYVVGDVRLALLVLLASVAFVLLIACANVANLLLARATGRQQEIAIRAALGAKRGRVVRQLLTESVLLSLLGGFFGLLLALWSVDVLRSTNIIRLPHIQKLEVNQTVLLFTLLLSIVTGFVFGLVPALQVTKLDLVGSLKDTSQGLSGKAKPHIRNLLVVSEVALALVLLIGSALLMKSFYLLRSIDPGFDTQNVLTMDIRLTDARYPEPQQTRTFYQQVLDQAKQIPGVQAIGATDHLPLSDYSMMVITRVEGYEPPLDSNNEAVSFCTVTPDYFRAMGIPLLQGRGFEETDHSDAPGVAIVNQAFVKKYITDQNPLGKRIQVPFVSNSQARIIGVVKDILQSGLGSEPEPEVYISYLQHPSPRMTLAIRATQNPMQIASIIRGQIRTLDKDQPVHSILTMEERLSSSIAPQKLNMLLLGSFAVLALLLSAVGIYGVMAYTVTQQTREIGIRIALGAQTQDVLRMVLKHGLTLAISGVALGLLGSLAVTRVLASLLYGITVTDLPTYAGVAILFVLVALAACYLPARRAAKVDPMVALRYE